MSDNILEIEDVIDQRFCTTAELCDITGLSMQTVHNKLSLGTAPVQPHGKLLIGRMNFNIWLRSDARIWAAYRTNRTRKARRA